MYHMMNITYILSQSTIQTYTYKTKLQGNSFLSTVVSQHSVYLKHLQTLSDVC